MTTGYEIEPMIAVEEDLMESLAAHYKVDVNVNDALAGVMKDFDGELNLNSVEEEELSEAELREMGEDAPIIRLANRNISAYSRPTAKPCCNTNGTAPYLPIMSANSISICKPAGKLATI